MPHPAGHEEMAGFAGREELQGNRAGADRKTGRPEVALNASGTNTFKTLLHVSINALKGFLF
jgi:hypothetical protein